MKLVIKGFHKLYFTIIILFTVPDSPVSSLKSGGALLGVPRRMRDAVAELHNIIQKWNDNHLIGIKILQNIREIKLQKM